MVFCITPTREPLLLFPDRRRWEAMRKAQEIRLCRPYSVAWSIPLGKQQPGSKSCSPARHALTGVTLSRKIQCSHFTSYHHPSVSYCDFIDLIYSFWSAMGKSWTTPTEKTFLDAEFENYLSNQGEKKYSTRRWWRRQQRQQSCNG